MRALAAFLIVAGLAQPAWCQDPAPPPSPDPPIDAAKLGVSLSRIQKGLFIAEAREKQGDGYRLQFNVQVYGLAPKIEVLKGVDLIGGAVPGSAPTHRQMIEFGTPVIYRTPTMPISTLAFWAASQIWQKSKKKACEEEIATYRSLVMQGVSVAAPRCTQ
jgi:hypothetical protein